MGPDRGSGRNRRQRGLAHHLIGCHRTDNTLLKTRGHSHLSLEYYLISPRQRHRYERARTMASPGLCISISLTLHRRGLVLHIFDAP